MYRISEIKLGLNEDKANIPKRILEKIKKDNIVVTDFKIVRESIDARDKGDIKMVYTVDFATDIDISKEAEALKIKEAPSTTYEFTEFGEKIMKNRPIIVGFGPCGMFAGLVLSEMGYRPIIIERGKPIESRIGDVEKFWNEGILDEESNVQFGEGGAGTFSDGKLTTQIKDFRIHKVLNELVLAGSDKEILYKQKPHIGTDVLRGVVANIRGAIIKNGGELRFNSKLTDIKITDGAVSAVQINSQEWIECDDVILAIGHSARDTFKIFNEKGMTIAQKPFSMGVRIEHAQELINKAQYGAAKEELGAADYQLSHRCKGGRGVYTFCMCPGGQVIVASSQRGGLTTNGMSYHDRASKLANSALLVDVKTSDFGSEHPLAGVEFQEKYEKLAFVQGGENYRAPKATWKEFSQNLPNGKKVKNCLPTFVTEAILEAMPCLGRKLRGFDSPTATLTAVETRSSSPIRMVRDEGLESSIKGIYPGGEGAGYAGGITSSAVDGIKLAEKIAMKYLRGEK